MRALYVITSGSRALPLLLYQQLQGPLCIVAALFAGTDESAVCDYLRLQALPLHIHQQLQGLLSIAALCPGIDERARPSRCISTNSCQAFSALPPFAQVLMRERRM